jgi:hypothetical protein
MSLNKQFLNPKVWGPHYWFVLHTIALTYPNKPNETVKKKYYDFIQNLPLFIPIENMGNFFSNLLDTYPVTPYLDSRESFIKWMYFIHNRVNKELDYKQISLSESLEEYYKNYTNYHNNSNKSNSIIIKKEYISFLIITALLFLAIYYYKKT